MPNRFSRFSPARALLASVAVVLAWGCGGGDSGTPLATPVLATCGPTSYGAIEIVPDNKGPDAPLVTESSPPLCEDALQADFALVFAPDKTDYSRLRFREFFVPNTSMLSCPAGSVVLGTPQVSPEITAPSLSPTHWVDHNGRRIGDQETIDTVLPSGCSLTSTVLDQWSFPAATRDIPAAQAVCGGGFAADGWKTFARKLNSVTRTGSVIRSCKAVEGSAVGECIDFDITPRIALPFVVPVPTAGGLVTLHPSTIVASPATHTCKLWKATSGAAFVRVARQVARKDVAATSTLELDVQQNFGPARSGVVTVGYGPGAQVDVEIEQAGYPAPSSCISLPAIGANVWHYRTAQSHTCQGSFTALEFATLVTGSWRITQNGCTVNLVSLGTAPVTETVGTMDGNTLGFALYRDTPEALYITKGAWAYTGAVTAAYPRVDVTFTARFSGSYLGAPGSCETTGSEVWTPIYLPIPP